MSEASGTLNMELNTFHRRVQQMLALGLVTVIREEVRDEHRAKLYRATRTEFVIPIEATSSINLETFLDTTFKGSASEMPMPSHGRGGNCPLKLIVERQRGAGLHATPP